MFPSPLRLGARIRLTGLGRYHVGHAPLSGRHSFVRAQQDGLTRLCCSVDHSPPRMLVLISVCRMECTLESSVWLNTLDALQTRFWEASDVQMHLATCGTAVCPDVVVISVCHFVHAAAATNAALRLRLILPCSFPLPVFSIILCSRQHPGPSRSLSTAPSRRATIPGVGSSLPWVHVPFLPSRLVQSSELVNVGRASRRTLGVVVPGGTVIIMSVSSFAYVQGKASHRVACCPRGPRE